MSANHLSLARFTALRLDPDKGRGRAPHKPLLLLAVLDLLEAGQITDGWVTLSPDLVVRFQNLWPIVYARRQNQGDIRLPFHALSGDSVWAVFEDDGRPSRARATSVRAKLDENLFAALCDSAFRAQLRRLLVATYFPPAEQVALAAALGFERALDSAEIAAFAHDQAAYRAACEVGRSARFKSEVVTGYKFTCALTGYRLTTVSQVGIVEAAHIHQHAKSRNNDPDNGLVLTPTAHALFDMGLWSATDDLRVIVKPAADFAEEGPEGCFRLRALAGRALTLPSSLRLRPSPVHLAWHRREHGFAS
jgi:putative restriction endonuclease